MNSSAHGLSQKILKVHVLVFSDDKTQEELLKTTQLVYSYQSGKMVSLPCCLGQFRDKGVDQDLLIDSFSLMDKAKVGRVENTAVLRQQCTMGVTTTTPCWATVTPKGAFALSSLKIKKPVLTLR